MLEFSPNIENNYSRMLNIFFGFALLTSFCSFCLSPNLLGCTSEWCEIEFMLIKKILGAGAAKTGQIMISKFYSNKRSFKFSVLVRQRLGRL